MRRTPGQIDQVFLDWATTGIESGIGVRVLDNEGATTVARTTGFVEFPAGTGLYYLDPFTFPEDRGSYTLLFDVDAGVGAPGNTATEELEITSSLGDPFVGDTYADTDELARILSVRAPITAEKQLALERVLIAATYEINEEIDREDDDPVSGAEISLATQVCLERAAELWKLQEVQFGIIMGGEFGATHIARNTWDKYAYTLAPLKRQWGIA